MLGSSTRFCNPVLKFQFFWRHYSDIFCLISYLKAECMLEGNLPLFVVYGKAIYFIHNKSNSRLAQLSQGLFFLDFQRPMKMIMSKRYYVNHDCYLELKYLFKIDFLLFVFKLVLSTYMFLSKFIYSKEISEIRLIPTSLINLQLSCLINTWDILTSFIIHSNTVVIPHYLAFVLYQNSHCKALWRNWIFLYSF